MSGLGLSFLSSGMVQNGYVLMNIATGQAVSDQFFKMKISAEKFANVHFPSGWRSSLAIVKAKRKIVWKPKYMKEMRNDE